MVVVVGASHCHYPPTWGGAGGRKMGGGWGAGGSLPPDGTIYTKVQDVKDTTSSMK